MSDLIKVSTVEKDSFDLVIDYLLTFRCNYDCSYCTSHDVNHPPLNRSINEIIQALNFIFKHYPNKKIKLGKKIFLREICERVNHFNQRPRLTVDS